DGHDVLGAELLWKAEDEREWRRVLMEPLPNDRWVAAFAPGRIGRHYFSVEAWRDEFASLRRDIEIKHRAGVDVALEVTEGPEFAHARAGTGLGKRRRPRRRPGAFRCRGGGRTHRDTARAIDACRHGGGRAAPVPYPARAAPSTRDRAAAGGLCQLVRTFSSL